MVQRERFSNWDARKGEYLSSIAEETRLTAMSVDEREREAAVLQIVTAAKREGMEVSEAEQQFIRDQIGLQQQLNELRQYGAQFGASLASNVWDAFEEKGNRVRRMLAGILQDLSNIGRQSFSQALSSGFGSLFAGTFGGTSRQLSNPGGMTGPPTAVPGQGPP